MLVEANKAKNTSLGSAKKAGKAALRGLKIVNYIPTIVLVLLILQGCFLAFVLQGYFALTHETVVAEVIMYPAQTDEFGMYIEIDFIPYETQSAIDNAINGDPDGRPAQREAERYKLYGDTVAIRGPLLTLRHSLRFLGFENVYKLAIIEGEYRMPGAIGEGTEVEINGGVEASWWDRNDQEADFPYNTVIRRITLSGDEEFGFFEGPPKRYEIVVTNDTITWNFVGSVE